MKWRIILKFKRVCILSLRKFNYDRYRHIFYLTLISMLLILLISQTRDFDFDFAFDNKILIEQEFRLPNGTEIKIQRLPKALIIGVSKCGKI
jgi:hypothetical protein